MSRKNLVELRAVEDASGPAPVRVRDPYIW